MRLITFQSMQVFEELCGNNVYYMEEYVGHRLKSVDMKYCADGNIPIYAFASIDGLPLSLEAIGSGMRTISSVGGLTDRLMLELEVPESEILSMKRCVLFEDRIDVEYTQDFGQHLHDEFYSDNKITYEVTLPKLKYDWLVCVRIPYKGYISVGHGRFPCVRWETVVLCWDKYPLWHRSVIFFASYKIADSMTMKSVENVDVYLSDKCSLELLVVQALGGVLTEAASVSFCRDYLGVQSLDEAFEILRHTDKIYMKDWEVDKICV